MALWRAFVKVGLVGKPNVGKSTFYAAATLAQAEIANYPFTTIEANRGVGYVRVRDPGADLGVTSTPRHGRVAGEIRYVPVEIVDVAGLVPGAHEGRGLGNRFLGDLAQADALIHVVDASGGTDGEGNPVDAGTHDPLDDVRFLEDEIDHWILGILSDGWDRLARRVQQENRKLEVALAERLNGIGVDEAHAAAALRAAGMAGMRPAEVRPEQMMDLARAVRRASKPMVVALNKADLVPAERLAALEGAIEVPTIRVSAQSELALGKGSQAGLLSYEPGATDFELTGALSEAQVKGMEYIRSHVLAPHGGTGVHKALEAVVFDLLGRIPVYPVEDDHHFTDKDGNVLPDCHLVAKGTTARQLAYKVHTDLGEHFVRGMDCRTRRVIGAEHELQPGDVIRIAANA